MVDVELFHYSPFARIQSNCVCYISVFICSVYPLLHQVQMSEQYVSFTKKEKNNQGERKTIWNEDLGI